MACCGKKAVLIGIPLAVLCGILWTANWGTLAQDDPGTGAKQSDAKNLAVLRDAFRGQNVSVFFINGTSPAMEGMVKGVTELFGKRFLRLETSSGNVRLALIEQIVAIRQKDK